MDKIARRSARDRSDLFSETASKLGIRPTIVEKDFWVCLVLNLLFVKSPFKQSLVFKGGTSLSKVYRLIERFSEDIDLVLDWQLIGFGEGLKDPMQNFDSKGKQDRFNKGINQLAVAFVADQLCPQLDELVRRENLGLSAAVDKTDSHAVNILYPAAFSEEYIRPEVRLEIGPLASWVPSATHIIQPYAYEAFPKLFENPDTPVVAITAERTFWEKATILHQEAHRKMLIPKRCSRHYYDLYKLALSPTRTAHLLNSTSCTTSFSSKNASIPQIGLDTIERSQAHSSYCPTMMSSSSIWSATTQTCRSCSSANLQLFIRLLMGFANSKRRSTRSPHLKKRSVRTDKYEPRVDDTSGG
jgi:hypothetical protein